MTTIEISTQDLASTIFFSFYNLFTAHSIGDVVLVEHFQKVCQLKLKIRWILPKTKLFPLESKKQITSRIFKVRRPQGASRSLWNKIRNWLYSNESYEVWTLSFHLPMRNFVVWAMSFRWHNKLPVIGDSDLVQRFISDFDFVWAFIRDSDFVHRFISDVFSFQMSIVMSFVCRFGDFYFIRRFNGDDACGPFC